ncbi:MAG: hypothetical protein H8D67_04530 [Deltaproteobacteria bacterium]|nr:hypothetical protein [Deltaproteobacteria bacterium]MBL7175313.1 hypothetical protein [Desulfobacteraceae bacterium]
MRSIKKLFIFVVLGAALYVLLSYHFIFIGNSIRMLKKSYLTLEYTIFSTKAKSVESILAIDELREAGIGELLVKMGEKGKALERYRQESEEEED